MTEAWRDIPGYKGVYAVSDQGRVKRLACTIVHRNRWGLMSRRKPEKILRPSCGRGGHHRLCLHHNDGGRLVFVHRLVALAFIGPQPNERPLVAHKDGVPSNNRPANLYWASPADNSADAIRHGTQVRGSRVTIAKLTDNEVREIRRRTSSGAAYARVARDYGVTPRTIQLAAKRKTWRHI